MSSGGMDDFDKIINGLDNLDKLALAALKQIVSNIAHHVVERAVANAPILTGDLRASFQVQGPRLVPSGEGIAVQAEVVNTVEYALLQHYMLSPVGPWRLGPISRQQPGTPEGGVGGAYIERVVYFHAAKYDAYLKEKLNAAVGDAVSSNFRNFSFRSIGTVFKT